ncbi:MAG: hypothetical protein IPI30_05865 [Saprospiraceae bacterium]|nr:hypothetical protein [Candidatus Vicinibacter affinis]
MKIDRAKDSTALENPYAFHICILQKDSFPDDNYPEDGSLYVENFSQALKKHFFALEVDYTEEDALDTDDPPGLKSG